LQNFFGKDTQLIHSGDAIVEYLREIFHLTPMQQETKINFFASENPDALKKTAQKWLYDNR
jgi:glutamate racemase